MNRKSYWSVSALVISTLIFSTVAFLTSCSSSSKKTPPVVAVAATSGTPQSAAVGAAFGAPLVATVTTGGTPTANVSVTFTAPASGASGTFATSTPGATDTEVTNSSGVATSQVFTANTTAGAYTVTASATGATSASFSLTNTAGAAATITATGGTPQSATVSTAFGTALAATVVDSDSNPVSGVVVTFTAPASGASGTFASNSTATEMQPTGANGVATSSVFTANATAGAYTVTAAAAGVATPANFSLTNTAVVVAPPLAAGNYVYSVTGEDNNSSGAGPYFVAGVFTVSASGAVTGGEQTYSDFTLFAQDNIVSATSSVVAGNLGNVLITLDTGDATIGVAGVETFNASMVSTTNGLLAEYDSWASGSGTLDLQTSTAAPSAGYAFFTAGVDASFVPLVAGGVVNVDNVGGAGNISGAGSVFDINDGGILSADQSFTASTVTAPDALGLVTFDLNTSSSVGLGLPEFEMVGYIVDADHIRWVENWFNDVVNSSTGGTALGQGNKTGTYSSADLSGSSGVFGGIGADQNGLLQAAGLITFNANLSISGNVSFNDFLLQSPQGGTTLAAGGTYIVDTTGRVTIANVTDGATFTYNLQLYLAKGGGTVISMDALDAFAGLGYGQTGSGAFTASSFSGNYAMDVTQSDTDSIDVFEYDGVGTVNADGTSAFTGSLDLNIDLVPTPGTAGGVTGTFTSSANGVFTGTISGISSSGAASDDFTFYLIGATSGASVGVIGIENDADQITLGTFELQQ